MYTVLIADDERIERKGIRSLIEKKDPDCRILEATNGKEAAALMGAEDIDILLTDIRMPFLSGLDLAKQAAEDKREMQTILLSGFQDFDYARTAIEYGVKDYILKPVDPCEFNRAYESAQQCLRKREEAMKSREKTSKALSRYFMSRYIMESKPSVLSEAEGHVDFAIWEKIHYICLIEGTDDFFEESEEQFRNVLNDYFLEKVTYLNLNTNQALLLFLEEPKNLLREAEGFSHRLYMDFCMEFWIAVSGRMESYKELPRVYRKLDSLMEEKFYQTGRKVFCENPEDPGDKAINEGQLLGMLERDIRNRDVYHLEEHFHRVVKKYSTSHQFPTMYVKFVFSNLVKAMWESTAMMQTERLEKVVDEMYACQTIAGITEITEKQMAKYMQFIAEDKGSLKYKTELTKEYVRSHYGEDINLDVLARRLYLSAGYLSMIFKKETGENLNQYIKNIRLEKSAELLKSTDKSISEIGCDVGFKNMSYFCKCFRQQYGITPDTYRKQAALS